MKKLLLSMVFFPFLSTAQKYELGLSGGVNYCATTHISMSQPNTLMQVQGKGGYAIGVSIARNFFSKKCGAINRPVWQVGLKLDAQQIRARGVMYNPFIMYLDNFMAPPRQTFHLAEPAISPLLFVNKRVNFRKSCIYGGVSAGPTFTISNPEKSTTYNTYLSGGRGFVVGGQIGYSRDLTPRLGLNAELAARYYSVKVNTGMGDWTTMVVPISIGVRYNIGKVSSTNDRK